MKNEVRLNKWTNAELLRWQNKPCKEKYGHKCPLGMSIERPNEFACRRCYEIWLKEDAINLTGDEMFFDAGFHECSKGYDYLAYAGPKESSYIKVVMKEDGSSYIRTEEPVVMRFEFCDTLRKCAEKRIEEARMMGGRLYWY